jgi:hypothetical protein
MDRPALTFCAHKDRPALTFCAHKDRPMGRLAGLPILICAHKDRPAPQHARISAKRGDGGDMRACGKEGGGSCWPGIKAGTLGR